MKLQENTAMRLTKHQQVVLAKIVASPEGIVPESTLKADRNAVVATEYLIKAGFVVQLGDNEFKITDSGMDIARAHNIVDNFVGLTAAGEKLAYVKESTTFKQFLANQTS